MTNFATKKGIQEIKRSRMEKTKKKKNKPNPETKLVVGQKTTKRILSHILIPLKIQVCLKGSQISDLWLFATFNIQSLLPLLPTAIILGFVLPSKNLSLSQKKKKSVGRQPALLPSFTYTPSWPAAAAKTITAF